MTNTEKINQLAVKTSRVITDRNVEGTMGLYVSSAAWRDGKISLRVMTKLPEKLTCDEAKEIGWALYMLGKYGNELSSDDEHEIDDDFFMD